MGVYRQEIDGKTDIVIHEVGIEGMLRLFEFIFGDGTYKDGPMLLFATGGKLLQDFDIIPSLFEGVLETDFVSECSYAVDNTGTFGIRRANLDLHNNKLTLTLFVSSEFIQYEDIMRELCIFSFYQGDRKYAKALAQYKYMKTDVLLNYIQKNVSNSLDFSISVVVECEGDKSLGNIYYINASTAFTRNMSSDIETYICYGIKSQISPSFFRTWGDRCVSFV